MRFFARKSYQSSNLPYKLLIIKTLWRRERDSNPRYPFGHNGFQDRRYQPLTHPSAGPRVALLLSLLHRQFGPDPQSGPGRPQASQPRHTSDSERRRLPRRREPPRSPRSFSPSLTSSSSMSSQARWVGLEWSWEAPRYRSPSRPPSPSRR
jgi:hypothetical protein